MFTFENTIFASEALFFWTLTGESRKLIVERADSLSAPPVEGTTYQMTSLVHPEDLAEIEHALDAAIAGTAPLNHEFRIVGPDGQVYWLYVAGKWSYGRTDQLSGIALNITDKKAVQAKLLQHEAQLRAVTEQDKMGIFIKDLQGHFVLANQYIEKLAGRRGGHIEGRNEAELLTQHELDKIRSIDQRVMQTLEPASFEWTFGQQETQMSFLMNVAPYQQNGVVAGVVGFVHDVTARKAQEDTLAELTRTLEAKVAQRTQDLERLNARLLHATLHDSLTGLPNRALLTQRLQAILERKNGGQDQPSFALLFIDLVKFKSVNDNLGHAAGDDLLLQVGARLTRLRPEWMVARLGGDEFVMLLDQLTDRQEALTAADEVQALFQTPFTVGVHDLLMSASIGVTLGDDQDDSAESFLQQADIAMYRAKTSNSQRYQVFEPGMRARRRMLVGLQQDIKHALRREELFIEYHPIVALPSLKIAGVEALVRWQHPVHGLISPNEFIPIAEEAGVIHEIDLWVFRQACRATAEYARDGRLYRLNFNLSARNFEHDDLLESLQTILQEEHFPPDHLAVEVTESILVQNFRLVSQILWELRNLGVMIAADDFGTGYSSLSYLHRLPFTSLKLDRSFIVAADHSSAFLRPVLELAQLLKMRVIAEGVETEAQLAVLTEIGCQFAQGYLFYRPMPGEELLNVLDQPGMAYSD